MAAQMVNYVAVVIAALAAFGLGMIWYTVLSDPWRRARGLAEPDTARRGMAVPFMINLVALFVMAWMLAGVMGHIGQVSVRGGLITGALIWLGFVITTIGISHAYTGAKPILTLIDGGYWLAALAIMGAVIGAFGL